MKEKLQLRNECAAVASQCPQIQVNVGAARRGCPYCRN
jgi:hypothetical protein